MSEAVDVGSTEQQADPKPTALTAREAAQRLVQAKQEKAQELRQTVTEPSQEAPETNAETSVTEGPGGPGPVEPAEADAIDYSALNMAEVAAPVVERDQDQVTDNDTPAQSFTLKHNGQEQTVTQAEAVDLAQMGLDYRKKTADLAEQRRATEAQQAALQAELDSLRQDRKRLAAHLNKFTTDVQPPDPELANTDYEAFNEQMAKYQAAQLQAEQVAKDLDAQREKEAEALKARQAQAYNQHMQRLHTRVPDMAKQEVAHAVGRYLTADGMFSGDELIKGLIAPADSRFQEIAYKAFQYDLARAKGKQLRAQPPKVASGGQRTGVVSGGPQKPTGKDARDPRKVAEFLKQRKAR